jgi:lysophospholipase L1-like esterase
LLARKTTMNVYVIGDSISIQYGPYLKQYLVGVMDYARKEEGSEALLNLDNPQGANGGDSTMVLSFVKTLAKSGGIDADLLLVNCGLHDIKRNPETGKVQVSIDHYENTLRSILSTVRHMRPKLVWIRTTPCDEQVHNRPGMGFHRFSVDCAAYNTVADHVMSEAGVPSIDLHTFTCNLGPDLYCDHVHFHEHIREKQGAFIAGWLNCWMNVNAANRQMQTIAAKSGSV